MLIKFLWKKSILTLWTGKINAKITRDKNLLNALGKYDTQNTRRKKVYIDVKIRHTAKSGLKHDI